ncbi:hypothetical protein [Streptomyces sp. NPDC007905]|uniref:hypothetical protein n=1 Tax=Streptomyces sp. NPDC007905 TaxID=3364788 RepID=UPI0036E6DA3E
MFNGLLVVCSGTAEALALRREAADEEQDDDPAAAHERARRALGRRTEAAADRRGEKAEGNVDDEVADQV